MSRALVCAEIGDYPVFENSSALDYRPLMTAPFKKRVSTYIENHPFQMGSTQAKAKPLFTRLQICPNTSCFGAVGERDAPIKPVEIS